MASTVPWGVISTLPNQNKSKESKEKGVSSAYSTKRIYNGIYLEGGKIMKLAAALIERADLQTRLTQLQTRLLNNAKVQEGVKPNEDPKDLLKELDEVSKQLEDYIYRINMTNAATLVDETPLTSLLAKKDVLIKKIGILRAFLNESSALVDRYSLKEIKIDSTVDVAKLQKDLDALSKELRLLDQKIQEINWTTDLI